MYFDDSHDTEDAATQLDITWRDLRGELEKQGMGGPVIEGLERAILDAPPPVGRSGRALIAGPDGVLLDEHLIRPAPATVVRVSELPYLVPMVEHGEERETYVVVSVDHQGADLSIHRPGGESTETVQPGNYPVHKANSAESPGYGDPQLRADEQSRKNLRAVGERLTQLIDDDGINLIFVVGEVSSRSDLVSKLPERTADRVVALDVGARDSGPHDEKLNHAIEEELLKRRLAVMDQAAQRFRPNWDVNPDWPPRAWTPSARLCARARSRPSSSATSAMRPLSPTTT
ncbi:MAG: hypothetical protein K0R68_278 [Mycobacterium sp.]|nr:hypothetical protein [Mycobacterium sp.]